MSLTGRHFGFSRPTVCRWLERFERQRHAETDLASLQEALRDWEVTYGIIRPHQALGDLTPAEVTWMSPNPWVRG